MVMANSKEIYYFSLLCFYFKFELNISYLMNWNSQLYYNYAVQLNVPTLSVDYMTYVNK